MKEKPILSIIIPVYNSKNYLKECLDSVVSNNLNQVEILVINDGSDDGSAKIIKEYSNRYPQIIYYNRENRGVSSSRNFGLRKSKGEWIWFIDSDDIILTQTFKEICQLLVSTNLDVFLFQYREFEDKVNYKIRKKVYLNNAKEKISRYDAMKSLINSNYATFPWNKIFKRTLFSNIEFPEDRNFTEDMAVIYRLYDKASLFYITTESLYFYRQRQNSLIHTISVDKLKSSALSHYEMTVFFEKKYPKLTQKLEIETLISIISYFHRINYREIKNNQVLYTYVINNKNYSKLNIRYKLETLSLKYCYPFFKLIGCMGILKRKLKNEK